MSLLSGQRPEKFYILAKNKNKKIIYLTCSKDFAQKASLTKINVANFSIISRFFSYISAELQWTEGTGLEVFIDCTCSALTAHFQFIRVVFKFSDSHTLYLVCVVPCNIFLNEKEQ